MPKLDEYRRKRDFRRTPEPAATPRRGPRTGGLFVVHKHAARQLHYDLRLEHDGVLVSWAVPKGPSLVPGEKRLAVHVEDHPLDYGDFEGVIPAGQYGAGTVMLWDRGRWQQTRRADGRLDFVLEGHKLRGAWTLTRMRGRDGRDGDNWLLIKRRDPHNGAASGAPRSESALPEDVSVATGRTMKEIAEDRPPARRARARGTSRGARDPSDDPSDDLSDETTDETTDETIDETIDETSDASADSTDGEVAPRQRAGRIEGARRAALPRDPRDPRPQLATLARDVPSGRGWIHEIKFDGYRILARLERGRVRLLSRNGKDWTHRFPEIAAALATRAIPAALLDGEIVALAPDGTSSFGRLQEALSEGRTASLVFQVFDLLFLDGFALDGAPQRERKRALADLLGSAGLSGGERVRYTEHIEGQGAAFFENACRLGLEGVVCKREDAPYRPGRNTHWIKVKCTQHDEFVVGGWADPRGARTGFGALLLGAFDGERLVYRGKVGTGFGERQLVELHATLRGLATDTSPFEPPPRERGVHWVRPELVVEVEFTERTRDGRLRHPAFRGVREDREPEEITVKAEEGAGAARSPRNRADAERAGAERTAGAGGARGASDGHARTPRASSEAGATRARSAARGTRPARRSSRSADDPVVAGVRLTHPERVLYPKQGITKLALARFYEAIGDWILPHLRRRPLSLVRCPEGRTGECFFQKHPGRTFGEDLPRVAIEERGGPASYVYVEDVADIVALVQVGTLELHVWGSRVDDLERPDLLVLDLDPGPGVAWRDVMAAAVALGDRLEQLGLATFVRTTGGKGLHVVTPLQPRLGWDEVKAFARAVARAHAADDPERLTANMAKAKRRGRIFIDYLRNGRGATAIASYSTRAREGAPVATPLRWDELTAALTPDRYGVGTLRRRLAALRADPWEGFEDARRPLTRRMLAAVLAEEDAR